MAKKETKNTGVTWDYSPALESTSHINLKKKYDLFIDGKWVKPSSGKYFDTINPANKEKLAEVAHANEKDVDKAVKPLVKHIKKFGQRRHRQNVQNTFIELHD